MSSESSRFSRAFKDVTLGCTFYWLAPGEAQGRHACYQKVSPREGLEVPTGLRRAFAADDVVHLRLVGRLDHLGAT